MANFLKQSGVVSENSVPVGFAYIRFRSKETCETAYLLDRITGWNAYAQIGDGVKVALLVSAEPKGVCPSKFLGKFIPSSVK